MFGLSFLNSLFLWGLAAASVPVIIHLIKRNRAVKLPFAAMRFLKIDPNQRVKSQKLRQLILLLMRITALLLLALAFARPFFSEAGSGTLWGEQPQAAVILIDNSFSMGYDDNFQKAISKGKEIAQAFKPGDQLTIMQFAESVQIMGEAVSDFASLNHNFDDRMSLSQHSTNYAQAIQAAETTLLQSAYQSKTIYLVSDFQKTGWDNLRRQVDIQPGIQINPVVIASKDAQNIAVPDVRIVKKDGQLRRGDVLARVKNYGGKTRKINVTLNINGRQISQKNVTLPGGAEKIIPFKNINFPKGMASGFVEAISDEAITADNRFYFVLENKSKAQILAVNGEPHRDAAQDELFFVDRAINLPKVAKYSLIQCRPSEINRYDFHNYRAVLLANVKSLGRDAVDRLTYYVRGGGGLIISLGDQISPSIFNQLFRDLSPARLTQRAFDAPNRDAGVVLAEIDYQHPIFRLFSDPAQGDPGTAQIYQYFHTQPLDEESVLAYFDDGSPAVLERRIGAGKVILFTSTYDTEWGNLPIKGLFLPILYQELQYVASAKKGRKSYLIGNPVSLQSYTQQSRYQTFVKLPSGEKVEVQTEIFDATDEPGIYEIQNANQKRVGYFAINVDSRESDLTAVSQKDLAEQFAGTSDEQVFAATIPAALLNSQKEGNQKLWRLVILAVLLLLVGETWLANRTYR